MSVIPVNSSLVSQKLNFHGTSISAAHQVKSEVERNEKRSFKASASALATSALGTPAMLFVGSLSMGLPGIVAVANGFMGFGLGSYLGLKASRIMENPNRKKIVKDYVPAVSEWLTHTYGVSFPSYSVEDITEIILGSTPNSGFSFTDTNTGEVFVLREHSHGWVIQNKNLPVESYVNPLDAFCEVLGEYHLESMQVFFSTRRKITVLKEMNLTSEEIHALQQVNDDMEEALLIAGQLKTLKDPDYLMLLQNSLSTISSRLDGIMEQYRRYVRSRILEKADVGNSAEM